MSTQKKIIEAILTAISDLFRVLFYTLFMLYVATILFEVELNPSFPLHGFELMIGSIVSALVSLGIKLYLLK